MDLRLTTPRLQLVAATYEHLCAELQATEKLAAMLGVYVPGDWPVGEYDRDAQETFRDWLQAGGPAAVGWYLWYAIRTPSAEQPTAQEHSQPRCSVSKVEAGATDSADGRCRQVRPELVGAGGFLGPPDPSGLVEVGFSVLPAWRGQGLATEMTEALVRWAFADPRVQMVTAHFVPDNTASRRVLERAGFRPSDLPAEAADAAAAEMIRFARTRAASA